MKFYACALALVVLLPVLLAQSPGGLCKNSYQCFTSDCTTTKDCSDRYASSGSKWVCCDGCCNLRTNGNYGKCALLRCAYPLCAPGYTIFLPNGQCCPYCKPDNGNNSDSCYNIHCPMVACMEGYEVYQEEGECCATSCRPVEI